MVGRNEMRTTGEIDVDAVCDSCIYTIGGRLAKVTMWWPVMASRLSAAVKFIFVRSLLFSFLPWSVKSKESRGRHSQVFTSVLCLSSMQ